MIDGIGYVWLDWALTVLVSLAAILQFASARIPCGVDLVTAGRAMLTGGWGIGALWFWFVLLYGTGDIDLPPPMLLWIALAALGTVCLCLYRVHDEIGVVLENAERAE